MEKVIQARASLIIDKPFFGVQALKLDLLEDNSQETMYTDGKVIGYNRQFVEMLNISELKTVIAHEICHVMLCHHTRRNKRDFQLWNESCDYAVNEILQKNGFDLPKDCLISKEFTGLNAEQIFSVLSGRKKKDEPDTGDSNSNGSNGQNSPSNSPFAKDNKEKNDKLQKAGEIRDFQGDTKEEELKQQISTTQAANYAEKAGNLSGSLKEIVKTIQEPKLDWKEILNRFILDVVKNDYSMSKPNKRFLQTGFILPSLHSLELKPILIAIDTSGSINDTDKKLFASEITEIVETYNVPIQVLYCDTEIKNEQTFTQDNLPLKLDYKGGGGTKFSPVMRYIEKAENPFSCLVYLTDLECHDFGNEPDIPVLWVQTRGNYRLKVPFGEVVLLK